MTPHYFHIQINRSLSFESFSPIQPRLWTQRNRDTARERTRGDGNTHTNVQVLTHGKLTDVWLLISYNNLCWRPVDMPDLPWKANAFLPSSSLCAPESGPEKSLLPASLRYRQRHLHERQILNYNYPKQTQSCETNPAFIWKYKALAILHLIRPWTQSFTTVNSVNCCSCFYIHST